MRRFRLSSSAVMMCGLAVATVPSAAKAALFTVSPGQSIQAAVDSAPAGSTIVVLPGNYTETHGGVAAVRVTKQLRLIAKSKLPGVKVRILPGAGNQHGILVEPTNPGDPDVENVKIKGFTVEGFPKNGIFLRHVKGFSIDGNESIDNLENGIWPTLSANGLVKRNVSYGSLDSALWVEASENVRVLKNDLHHAPTGMEITISKNIRVERNDIHNNTVGVGLYHQDGAGLPPPPAGYAGDWIISQNHIHDNNEPNSAPPGGLSSQIPAGGGILLVGVDRVTVQRNIIENNDFFGVAVVDWCLAVNCTAQPPSGDPAPDDNRFISNTLLNNAGNPTPFGGLEFFAADFTYLVTGAGHVNCFADNSYTTLNGFGGQILANSCPPL